MSIWSLLGFGNTESSDDSHRPETETVRKIVAELDHLEPERARFVAAFAYLLSRVAGADLDVSVAETRTMERIVADRGGLPEEQAILVVQMAKSQNALFGGTENYLVTRELKRITTREQRVSLLECLFGVSAAEGGISTVESNVIRQIAAELRLDHSDFIEVRRRFRDHLAVLRPGEPDPVEGA